MRRRCWPSMRRRAASSIAPPIPIEDIVEKHLKLGIEFDDMHRLLRRAASGLGLDPDILGAICFDERRIVIDESLDPEENPSKEGRYRFTLAHEGGGHWRLHRHLFAKDPAQASLFDEPAAPSVVCRSSQAKEPDRVAGGFLCVVPADAAQAGHGRMGRDVPGSQAARPATSRPRSTIRSSRSRATECQIGNYRLLREPTTMRWIGSRGRWPRSFSFRRSPCASAWRSSACCFARSRTSAFLPVAA